MSYPSPPQARSSGNRSQTVREGDGEAPSEASEGDGEAPSEAARGGSSDGADTNAMTTATTTRAAMAPNVM